MWKYCPAVLAPVFCALTIGSFATVAPAETVVIPAAKDNTLLEVLINNSNGGDIGIYAGRDNAGRAKRGLIQFDIAAAVPAGATITSATLTLQMDKTHFLAGPATITLHRVQADWGEGIATGLGGGAPAGAGDATWVFRHFNTVPWINQGGDFDATPSASQTVNSNGTYNWTSAQLAADVQAWLDDPASNFGWLIKGDESTFPTAKRFGSREYFTEQGKPRLTVEYVPPPPPVTITAWRSVRTHGGLVDRAIALDPAATGDGLSGPTVEPRSGGLARIEVDFSAEVTVPPEAVTVSGQTTDNGVAGPPVEYTPASVSMLDADTLEIVFNPGQVPDQTCCTISISPGMVTGLTGDTDVQIRVLSGDTTMSGDVTLSDLLLVKTRMSTPVADAPAYDLNLDDVIDIDDVLAPKPRIGAAALCP